MGIASGNASAWLGGRMNVHHLELFYYVARHGGISAAVRQIPYGIQQPAVSGQMGKLEEEVGAKLFERSPFRLTPAGERLFAHVQPFFEGLAGVKEQLREAAEPELRLGGADFALRHHIPTVMSRLKKRFPGLRFSLRSGFQSQLEDWVREGQIDVAVTAVDTRPAARLRQLRLSHVPLVLLTPRGSKVKSSEQLWTSKRITEPLILLPASSAVTRSFQRGLKRLGVTWPRSAEAASVQLIADYVANGDGFGVSVALPLIVRRRDVRVLPLTGFDPMAIGAIWRGEPSPLVRALIDEVQAYARETWPEWAVADKLP
jgi:DNA-binding transcriptional LysR family regulator